VGSEPVSSRFHLFSHFLNLHLPYHIPNSKFLNLKSIFKISPDYAMARLRILSVCMYVCKGR
jgi:hypothetical protein